MKIVKIDVKKCNISGDLGKNRLEQISIVYVTYPNKIGTRV